jgi:hydrogenase maturation protein HypF
MLRDRKRRPDKPFALMARDLDAIERAAHISEREREALLSRARPIVLLRAPAASVAPSIAPGLAELGIMLPVTPLHHLLVREDCELIVLTSGNLADEPIVKDDDAALERLAGIADAFLVHDREIHTRADDSVMREIASEVRPIRRARGQVPIGLPVSGEARSVLAVGAEMKNTVCITRDREAFLSQHIGDLGHPDARAFFDEVVAKLGALLDVEPAIIAHDLHPDYASTRWALAQDLPRIPVQHHHAHVAACLAENGRASKAIGIAFDGTGCGPDGDAWGGEVLVFDLLSFERRGHLWPLPLPGGEAAIRQPWRVAAAALVDAHLPFDVLARIPRKSLDTVKRMIRRSIATPRATGAGRWFDAIASLLGVRDSISYEGQAAIELEAIAATWDRSAEPFPFVLDGEPFVIDLRPTVRGVVDSLGEHEPTARIAARFHATLAAAITASCVRIGNPRTVALSGGCFQNRLLVEETKRRLDAEGFEVLLHRHVPANDGGIAFGQAAIAVARKEAHVPRNPR